MNKLLAIVGTTTLALLLSACSGDDEGQSSQGSVNDGEQSSEFGSVDHGVKDKNDLGAESGESEVGFSLEGGSIEEAANVPADEKEAILDTFTRYIDTLNAGEVDAYLETLSEEGYDLDEERAATEEMLATTELTRTPDDITIVKFEDTEAQVFTTMKTEVKKKGSEEGEANIGRQVTVLTKDDATWKVSAVKYMGDPEPTE